MKRDERIEFERDIKESKSAAISVKKDGTNKYKRICKGAQIDVYDVLKAFNVTNPAISHAIKKLLAGGQRGYKDTVQDYKEAIASIVRGVELEEEQS